MGTPGCAEHEEALRTAVKALDYESAQARALIFCQAAERHMQSFAPADPEWVDTALRIRGILEWAILMFRTGRSLCADELRASAVLQNYINRTRALDRASGTASLDL
jgi:hypothetical protein